jgi:hypothetical protein
MSFRVDCAVWTSRIRRFLNVGGIFVMSTVMVIIVALVMIATRRCWCWRERIARFVRRSLWGSERGIGVAGDMFAMMREEMLAVVR